MSNASPDPAAPIPAQSASPFLHLRQSASSADPSIAVSGSEDKLKSLTAGKLFEFDLEVHHILLAGSVSGSAGIEAQATGLIKIPLGFLAV